jgi:hypothetical protein
VDAELIARAVSVAERLVDAVAQPHPRVPDELRPRIAQRMTGAMRVLWGELPLPQGQTLGGIVAQVAVARLIVEGLKDPRKEHDVQSRPIQ